MGFFMSKKIIFTLLLSLGFVGCASVPKADQQASDTVKQFTAPQDGNAGIYVYRSASVKGAALKKDVWVDGECLGETSRGVFFYKEVLGNRNHTISTESEFSPNHLEIQTEAGKQYFVQQFIKMGAFTGGANLKQVDEQTGKQAVSEYAFAKGGNCSKATLALK